MIFFTITDDHDEIIDIIKRAPVRESVPFTGLQPAIDAAVETLSDKTVDE